MEQNEWIVINYTLPREPSRIRVSIWRKLKRIGAVNMQQSMWILPLTGENGRLMAEIRNEVTGNGGEAFIMKSSVDEESRQTVVNKFNEARNEEYRELLEKCDDFFAEIEKEIARKNFTFAEIEENEEELRKLNEWFGKIAARDVFGAELRDGSKAALSKCEAVLDGFCDKVYYFNDKA